MQNFRKMFAEGRSFSEFAKISVRIRISAEFPINFCSPHPAEFVRKNRQQNFRKISEKLL